MKKEDVEKAAHEHSERYSADAYYSRDIGSFIDAAYEMLCWVIDNGYLKVK